MPTPNDFSNVRFRSQQDDYGTKYPPSATGEQNPQAPGTVPQETLRGLDGNQFYRPEPDNRQFSSKMSGDPKELVESTRAGVEAHADLLESYGIGMPVAGLGVHPWLRDSLAAPSPKEPGNAEPNQKYQRGMPFDENKGD
jgi:hypothetical protein